MKNLILKLMGVYRSELEKIIDSGYKLVHESDNELTYKKQNNYIIYDLNNDKIISQYKL
jgi:hypothetical protein